QHAAGAHDRVIRAASLARAASLLLGGRASDPNKYRSPPAVTPRPGLVETGIASWYGPGYHGKRTSSGEKFDQDDLTAAHERWTFGTRVRVTLLSTGKSVIVRINDRF